MLKFFPTNFQTSLKRKEYFMDFQTSLRGMQHFSGKVLWIVFYLSDTRWRKHVIYIILNLGTQTITRQNELNK